MSARSFEDWQRVLYEDYKREKYVDAVRVLSCITDSYDIALPTEMIAVFMLEAPHVMATYGQTWAVDWSRVSTVD